MKHIFIINPAARPENAYDEKKFAAEIYWKTRL